MARTYLTRDEWSQYEGQPPQGRRHWLLGRIALKDAVRAYVCSPDAFFAVELTTGCSDTGAPWVGGRFGRELPPLAVSVAHCGEVGVALVGPADDGPVGIEIVESDPVAAALGAAATALGVPSEDLEVTAVRGDDLIVGGLAVRVAELTFGGRRYVVARTRPANER
jgi:hypothetical protein